MLFFKQVEPCRGEVHQQCQLMKPDMPQPFPQIPRHLPVNIWIYMGHISSACSFDSTAFRHISTAFPQHYCCKASTLFFSGSPSMMAPTLATTTRLPSSAHGPKRTLQRTPWSKNANSGIKKWKNDNATQLFVNIVNLLSCFSIRIVVPLFPPACHSDTFIQQQPAKSKTTNEAQRCDVAPSR